MNTEKGLEYGKYRGGRTPLARLSILILRRTVVIAAFILFISQWMYTQVTVTGSTNANGNFTTLKGAFDAINANAQTGNDIVITITASTSESASVVLNAGAWVSIKIYPVSEGLTIGGNIAAPLIDLNGADNVTIDGRVVQEGGVSLTITNTSTSATSGTSTLRFINSAENNNVKYCNLKGSESSASSGIILFSTASSGNGNDGNTISNNNITNAADGNRPVNAIYSSGSASYENSENTISSNNIYNFLNRGISSNGIYFYSRTTACNVSGNSFYETTSFAPTAAVTYNAILVSNTSGNGFVISGNYIGGSTSLCGGQAMTTTSSYATLFYGITLNVGLTTASSVQDNTIKNINYTSASSTPYAGIYVNAGVVNIGTVTGNTIGETSGNGSITLVNTTTNATSYAILINSSSAIDIQKNKIGSITSVGSVAYSHSIIGIYKQGVVGTLTISNNTIGSILTSNSIQASSASTSTTGQMVTGIRSYGQGSTTILGNTIANLYNAYAGGNTSSRTRGIDVSAGSNIIQNNLIRNLSSASGQEYYNVAASVIGISQSSNTASIPQTISGNTIYNLSNTNSSKIIHVYGIYFAGSTTGTNTITDNFIHSLSISSSNTASAIEGILTYTGASTISNNIINFGVGVTAGIAMYGIYDQGGSGNNNNICFNTVYIGGSATGATSSTYALYSYANTSTRNYRNNIFNNGRTGGSTGKHYAIYLAGSTSLTVDYNDYYVSVAGTLGRIGSTNYTVLDASWKTASGGDAHSVNINPVFMIAGSTTLGDYMPATTLAGITISGIALDIMGVTRPGTPTMGAVERGPFWVGTSSTDFNTASNWSNNAIPASGANIFFADNPDRSCFLDADRTIGALVINQSADKFVVNGHRLTITGTLALINGGQLDATPISSSVVFAGSSEQIIPSGAFYNDEVYNLTVNNPGNVVLNGTLNFLNLFTAASGQLDAFTNSPSVGYNGAVAQSIDSGQYLNEKLYDLTVHNSDSPSINTNLVTDHNLTIQSGSFVEVQAGKTLTVNGTTTNNAGASAFVFRSNSSGTASFLNNTNNVNASIERYFGDSTGNWHFLSSPVSGQSISGSWLPSGTYGNSTGYDLYIWNEPTSCWIYKLNTTGTPDWSTAHPSGSFIAGKGYLYSLQAVNPTKQFAGTLNNGTVSYGLTFNSTNAALKGFNLVGNPYPSSIDWKAPSGWTRSKLESSGSGYDMWIWNPEANNYGVYNSSDAGDVGTNSVTRYISPMQGFFVKASLSGNLVMTNAVKVSTGASNWLKQADDKMNKVKVRIESHSGNGFDEVLLQFGSSLNEPGASKLFSQSPVAPSLYLPWNGNPFSVMYLTQTNENPSVPLMFKPGSDGNYTLRIDFDTVEFDEFTLEDRETHSVLNIKTNNVYNFQASRIDNPNRFVLRFGSDPYIRDGELNTRIYFDGNEIILDLSMVDQNANVEMIDIMGRKLFSQNVDGKLIHRLPVPAKNEILFVLVRTAKTSLCRKLLVYSAQ